MAGAALLTGLLGAAHAEDTALGAFEAEATVGKASTTATVFEDGALSGGAGVRFGRPSGEIQPTADEAPALTLAFRKLEDAPFVLWARLLAPNTGTDSLLIRQGDGELRTVSLKAKPGWRWSVIWQTRSRQTEIALQLFPRESGLSLDRFDAASDFLAVPQGVSGELVIKLPELKAPFPEPPIRPPAEHPRVYVRRTHLPMLS